MKRKGCEGDGTGGISEPDGHAGWLSITDAFAATHLATVLVVDLTRCHFSLPVSRSRPAVLLLLVRLLLVLFLVKVLVFVRLLLVFVSLPSFGIVFLGLIL